MNKLCAFLRWAFKSNHSGKTLGLCDRAALDMVSLQSMLVGWARHLFSPGLGESFTYSVCWQAPQWNKDSNILGVKPVFKSLFSQTTAKMDFAIFIVNNSTGNNHKEENVIMWRYLFWFYLSGMIKGIHSDSISVTGFTESVFIMVFEK